MNYKPFAINARLLIDEAITTAGSIMISVLSSKWGMIGANPFLKDEPARK